MISGASAICLDLTSVRIFLEKIRKILVVPVCHHCTPAIGYFSKACLLAIIGLPWPMTKRGFATSKQQQPRTALRGQQERKEEQYHVLFNKIVKVGFQVAHVPCKRKSIKSIVSTTLKKMHPTFLNKDLNLGSDLNFGNNPKDSILMGLDSLMALDDSMNPFDFK
jgi:hypothetical protein